MEWKWSKVDDKGLARFVNSDVGRFLRLPENRQDLLQREDGRRQLIGAIYNALLNLDRKIRYAPEKYHPSEATQLIRKPCEIIGSPGEGTCLDLAAFFCGVCLAHDLLPLLILLEGHALAAVSLNYGLHKWDAWERGERELFREPLTDISQLHNLVDSGQYLVIECTGFAQTNSLPKSLPEGTGRIDGFLSFDQAIVVGRQQLNQTERPFRFALDIAVAHYQWGIEPLSQTTESSNRYFKGTDVDVKLNPQQAPPLPTYYVDRPECIQELKSDLLTQSSNPQTLLITAIHGLGSVGKSTLAAALARDTDVQAHFRDGILWATLGQQPDLLSLLSGWIQALGDYNFKATSKESASNQLRTLLYDKAVLLVIDDAWNPEHAQAFNVGGPRCQVLVTTRERVIADVLGASTYSLDVMKPEQAMKLLTNKLGRDIAATEQPQAEILAKELGYLPLALELAASQVKDGVSWVVLLQNLQGEIVRLKSFDRPGVRDITDETSLKRLSLTASLNLSIQRLSKETRENFIWLGILPEDVNITQKMTATLWDMDNEEDTADELRYLQDKSLLSSGLPLADKTTTYRLHDLFHDLARNLLTASLNPKRNGDLPGLGLTLPAAHTAFLEKYRQKTQDGLWHTLPNDGYIHQHLVWHLQKANKVEEIYSLLREEAETGGNGWYEACDRLGQTANFVTDVARAWQLAEDTWTETTLPQVIGLQCRYALMIASLNSLAANLPVALLVALVQKKVWTPEQGLAYVLQSSNSEQQVKLLTQLVNHLPPNLRELGLSKALAAAKVIQNEEKRADALCSIAPLLPPELLPEALNAARAIQFEKYRASALNSLAAKLPEVLEEALATAKQIKDESIRTNTLLALADKLPEVLEEALATAKQIKDESIRTNTLIFLADKLPQELLPQLLAEVYEIPNEWNRARALAALADRLPEVLPEALVAVAQYTLNELSRNRTLAALTDKLPQELLSQVLAAVYEIPNEWNRARALAALSSKYSDLLPEALALARQIQDEWNRVWTLAAIVNKKPEILSEALAAAEQIPNESSRVNCVMGLADKLPPELLPQLLAAAEQIQDESSRINCVIGLADKLPQELLPQVLAVAKLVQNELIRSNILAVLAYRMPPEMLPEVLAAAQQIQDNSSRANLLIVLANKLPDLLPQALAATMQIPVEFNRRHQMLAALANKLPPELLTHALAAAMQIQDEFIRALALATLADKLPELLPQALAAAMQIQREFIRTHALEALADKLPPDLLPQVLVATEQIQNESSRINLLIAIANEMPDLLPKVLIATEQIQNESSRVNLLITIANKIPDLLPQVLLAAEQLHDESSRANLLTSIAEKLPPELLPQALATAKQIQNDQYRANALKVLAGKLPPELLREALDTIKQTQDEWGYIYILCLLTKKLPYLLPETLDTIQQIQDERSCAHALIILGDEYSNILPEALVAVQKIQDESNRVNLLIAIADKLPPELLQQALATAREIQHESSRIRTLAALANQLPELLSEALATLKGIQNESNRAQTLAAIADQLLPEFLPEALAIAMDIYDEYSRAQALGAIANKLLPELLPQALATAREIQNDSSRANILGALAPLLSQMPKTLLFPNWQQTLHELSLRSRQNLLTDLGKLVSVIFALGGPKAIAEVNSAIQDVARWWR